MPISYSSEEKVWLLKDVTEEESRILLEVGKEAMIQMISVGVLRKLTDDQKQQNMLREIPGEVMGQA